MRRAVTTKSQMAFKKERKVVKENCEG